MIKQRWFSGALLVSMTCPLAAHATTNNATEEAIAESEIGLLASDVVGSVTQEDRVGGGWWVTSQVTLRDDGTLLGQTDLSNSNSALGYTAEVVVALVDANKQPLGFIPVGSWGINACFFSCPAKRGINWTQQVPEWNRIGADVRGMAVIQRHNPTNRFWDWLWGNRNDVLSLVGVLAKLF